METQLEVNKSVKTNDVQGENKGAAEANSVLSQLGKTKTEEAKVESVKVEKANEELIDEVMAPEEKSDQLKVRIQKVHEHATIPNYAHEGDSGMDLYSVEEHVLTPGERKLIPTGLKIALPIGYEAQVRPKSGLALKHGITIINTPGTVDAGYRGELGLIVINHGTFDYKIERKQKVAQLVIQKVERAKLEEVESLEDTQRGTGGFGSTGLNR